MEAIKSARRAGRNGSHKIRVALIGVGNCASSLVQGVHFYRNAPVAERVPGLMHVELGGYHVRTSSLPLHSAQRVPFLPLSSFQDRPAAEQFPGRAQMPLDMLLRLEVSSASISAFSVSDWHIRFEFINRRTPL